jgi:uncharacterized protein DUF6285
MSDEQDKRDKQKLVEALRVKLAERLAPVLADPRNRLRTIVAVKVLAIVNREIAQGEPPLDAEWANLKETVAGYEGAAELVSSLEAAVRGFSDDLRARIAAGEVEEAPARAAAAKVIRLALVKKLQLLAPVPGA